MGFAPPIKRPSPRAAKPVQQPAWPKGPVAFPDTDAGVALRRAVAAPPGRSLAPGLQAWLAPRFGQSVAHVRISSGAESNAAARAIGAQAFAIGPNLHFRAGLYPPSDIGQRFVLAHEVAHALQAPPLDGTAVSALGGTRAPEEQSAHQAARAAVWGMAPAPHLVPRSPVGGVVRRFGSAEHLQLGEEGSGKASTDLDVGSPGAPDFVSYGEMVALAADFFESLQQMRDLAKSQDGRDQIRWGRWKALGARPEPAVPASLKKIVMDRYFTLAAQNLPHFSTGGTARASYRASHALALTLAFRAGVTGDAKLFDDARTNEAFGNHFLTDMFSSGHVRTPRDEIRRWYGAMYPTSIEAFVRYMAAHMHTFLVAAHPAGDFFGRIPDQKELERRIRDIGGSALRAFSLGDIVSLGYHNLDNAGLAEMSEADPSGARPKGFFHFSGKGDRRLAESPVTKDLAVAAIRTSLAELESIRQQGAATVPARPVSAPGPEPDFKAAYERALQAFTPFGAEAYIPSEDPRGGNVEPAWRWGRFNKAMREAVDAALRTDVAGVLRDKARDQEPNVREALNDFADHLGKKGTAAVEEAVGAKAGP
jgi:hypothetical protein